MQYRKLGKTGFDVSEIGFGAWAIGGGWGPQEDQDSRDALHRALDLGVTLIDTAAGYGDGKSERIIGEVLKERPEQITVATKIHPLPTGPWPPSPYCDVDERYPAEYLEEMLEGRRQNLQTDCVDVVQLHTWTRAWNKNPRALEWLRTKQAEGKVRAVGVSTPETDQNSVIGLMRGGFVDVVQVIYNLFEQEPAAELLPAAVESNVGIIVRVPFDEGALTGKYAADHRFPPDDFRSNYFAGDRLARTLKRVERIVEDIRDTPYSLPQAALRFTLEHPAVSTVIPGMRNALQAEANCAVSDLPAMSPELLDKLHGHNWRRSFWYAGL
jgi:aryl-alcohol dehydrogenase-like predicted oxidoreductase